MAEKKKVLLAYSGGLDTTYCIIYLKEKGYDVLTVTVDTGGFTAEELRGIEERAAALGVLKHETIDGRQRVFDDYVSYLIKGNVLRGSVYPLAVAAERVVQAEIVAEIARAEGADAIAHGSTGAGNDQVRFDIAFSVLVPNLPVITPVRDETLSRDEEFDALERHGIDIPKTLRTYSINSGLWGATIGGGETHDPWQEVPDAVFEEAIDAPRATATEYVEIEFEHGVPVGLDGRTVPAVDVIAALGERCRSHRAGLGIHIGDTVLGIKGRIAFEAGAALVLITAHRELEKITTTAWQRFWKDHSAEFYGKMLHEGNAFDPVLRDIEALIDSSQERVSGTARIRFDAGQFRVVGVKSPHDMMRQESGVYGEKPTLWTGADVSGFSTVTAVSSRLHRQAGARDEGGS